MGSPSETNQHTIASLAQTPSGIGPDAITPPVSAAIEREKKTKKLNEGQPDIEYAEKGGEADLPAVVDIHGDVIKADWHVIRAKANEAEVYEHSLGLWQAMKTYKKVCSFVFALCSSSLCEAERKFSLTMDTGPFLVIYRLLVHHHGMF